MANVVVIYIALLTTFAFLSTIGERRIDSTDDAILSSFHHPAEKDDQSSDFIEFAGSSSWDQSQMSFPTFSPDEDSALMAKGSDYSSIEGISQLDISADAASPKDRSKEKRRRSKAKISVNQTI